MSKPGMFRTWHFVTCIFLCLFGIAGCLWWLSFIIGELRYLTN